MGFSTYLVSKHADVPRSGQWRVVQIYIYLARHNEPVQIVGFDMTSIEQIQQ